METCWSCLHVSMINSFSICMINWPVASCLLEWHSLESQTNWGQASRMCRDDSTFFRSRQHKRKVDIKLRSWRGSQLWLNSVLWLRSNFIIFFRWHLKVVEPIVPWAICIRKQTNETKLLSQLVNLANNSKKVSWCLVSTKPWQETTFYILTA